MGRKINTKTVLQVVYHQREILALAMKNGYFREAIEGSRA
jgi:hypothetical protein